MPAATCTSACAGSHMPPKWRAQRCEDGGRPLPLRTRRASELRGPKRPQRRPRDALSGCPESRSSSAIGSKTLGIALPSVDCGPARMKKPPRLATTQLTAEADQTETVSKRGGIERKRKFPDDWTGGFLNRARIKTDDTKICYREAVASFHRFANEQNLRLRSIADVDHGLELYLERLFRNGESDYMGRCALQDCNNTIDVRVQWSKGEGCASQLGNHYILLLPTKTARAILWHRECNRSEPSPATQTSAG